MKVLLFFKKHWFKIFSIALIGVVCVYVLCLGLKKAKDVNFFKSKQEETSIYTVWHIETFEGGGKSRIQYLKDIARSMEKEDESTLFVIKQVAPDDLDEELALSCPDIISFGFGVGDLILEKLNAIDNTYNVRDELLESGTFNKKLYAIPYIVSGYAMFTHSATASEFHCGQTGYTAPKNIYNELNLQPTESESQYEAYKDFVYDKNVKLLGTGRDLFRIDNLNKIGRANAIINPIDSYTDLIQYIGLCKTDSVTKEFLKRTLNEENQISLTDYSLFSSLYNKLYYDGIYNDMEDAIMSSFIPNVFNGY